MASVDYSGLSVLIADDFSNFRSTVTVMLARLGIKRVDTACDGAGVIEACQRHQYDVILCDYDLGPGQNGQQVLEELRYRKLISEGLLFIIISANAAKDVVMAAYDCEPSDYLMKPITARMLEQRLNRLLGIRNLLMPAYSALQNQELDGAVDALITLTVQDGRHAASAQKMLGELFVRRGELIKAEKLYLRVLEARQPDWAKLGLARVRRLRGEWEDANTRLEALLRENPLFLPAYDEMANNWESRGDPLKLQEIIQQSVVISPKSILRQTRLGAVAERNGDLSTAVGAYRRTVALGRHSCHAHAENHLDFARIAAQAIETKLSPVQPLSSEAVGILEQARKRYKLSDPQVMRAQLLEGRARHLAGEAKGQEIIARQLNLGDPADDVDVQLELIRATQTLGDRVSAREQTHRMLESHRDNEAILEKLDVLLDEPVSEFNKLLVANINREGIDLYNLGRFDEAVACFTQVKALFPNHVGIRLNILQALVGKMHTENNSQEAVAAAHETIAEIEGQIDRSHVQYERFQKLRKSTSAAQRN